MCLPCRNDTETHCHIRSDSQHVSAMAALEVFINLPLCGTITTTAFQSPTGAHKRKIKSYSHYHLHLTNSSTWQFPDFSPDQWARAGLHPAARSASLGTSYLDKATAEPGGLHSTPGSVLRGTTHTAALQSTALSASCTQGAARQCSHPCTPCCPFVSIFAPWDCKHTMSVQISAPRLCSVLFRAVSGPPWHDEPRPPSCALAEGQWYRHMSRAALGSLSLAADSYQALCCRKKYWWKSKVVLFLQASCN